MPATKYRIWQWGGPVKRGALGSYYVATAGVAKKATDDHPHAVSNELICGALARMLLLPVPPGFIVERDGTPYHVSLDFNLTGHALPPANPRRLVTEHPGLACGILLFDSWILNHDRHDENVAYDSGTKRVQLFDHSHALLPGRFNRDWLEYNEELLGIGDHCLKGEVVSLDGMQEWHDRIMAVPEYYIEAIVDSAVDVGLPRNEAESCKEFLFLRRERLLDLVSDHLQEFPLVQPDLWAASRAEEAEAPAVIATSPELIVGGEDE